MLSNVIGIVYEKRGGYGTGENFGPERYLSPAKSKFQKEMREISDITTKRTNMEHLDSKAY